MRQIVEAAARWRPRPLEAFGGLGLILLPFALPWQYLIRQSVVELESGPGFVVWEPGGTLYPFDTDAGVLLWVAAVMAIALVAGRSLSWLIYLAGGVFIWRAWIGRIRSDIGVSGWEGPGQAILDSVALPLGLCVYRLALLVAALFAYRTSADPLGFDRSGARRRETTTA